MDRKKKVAKKYDRWSKFYDTFDAGGQNKQKKLAVDVLELQPGNVLLDIGTGTGAILPYAAEKLNGQGKILAVDISPEMGKQVVSRALKEGGFDLLSFIVSDCDELPLPDESVDAVLATFAFTSFPTPEASMMDAARVLKPGGRISILDTGKPPEGTGQAKFKVLKPVMWRAGYTDIGLDVPELAEKAGLEIQKIYRFKGSLAYCVIAIKS